MSWKKLAGGTMDICRLVVAPRAFRLGHATAVLDALDLTERFGFTPVGTREVAPGVTVTLLERRRRQPA
jgi:hypothetical protein